MIKLMKPANKRAKLEQIVGEQIGRDLSASTIFFFQAAASLVGVSVTDMKCLDYIHRGERVTAGDLARLTGLTTGAITAVVDRLERVGMAKRERSDADRRKIYIQACAGPATERLLPFFEAIGAETKKLVRRYSTRELETIEDFCLRCIDIMKKQTEAIRLAEVRK